MRRHVWASFEKANTLDRWTGSRNKNHLVTRQYLAMASFLLLNGPNLNLLGTRQPEIYGATTLADIQQQLSQRATALGHSLTAKQSNCEGALVDILHEARGTLDGVIFNAGAYTHTSVALRDAISAIELPVIEVHMSNVHARESFRHHSHLSAVCLGVIAGFGAHSYELALDALIKHLKP